VAVLLFWAGALLRCESIGRRWVLLAIIPVALNPVAGAQVFTNYVDGMLASFIAILVILLIQVTRDHRPAAVDAAMPALAMTTALAVSTKLNGALYVVLIAGGYLAWALPTRRAGARAAAGWTAAGLLAAVLLIAWNPYMSRFATGTVYHGNPFHPHAHWSDIVNVESETLLPGMGRLERLSGSLLSRSVIWTDGGPDYKVPFRVSRNELSQFAAPDVRFGGFGPLFSGGLLLALATLALLLREPRRRVLPHAGPLLMAVVIGLSTLSFSEAWWARLAPQLAFAPVLVGVAGLAALARQRTEWLPRALILVLCLNSVLVFGAHGYFAIAQSEASRRQLRDIRAAGAEIAVPDLDGFPGLRHRLQRAGVTFREVDALPCGAEDRLVLTLEIEACVLPGEG
ncbi:MAG TPA: hypothetical protein VK936_08260, partial [Longimicrobiales bacterium]|nr:hypothetical protein [Longimicrobiales bacterium]